MIKVVYCFRKKWGLTDAEFSRYHRDVNGPLVARIPGLRRLVQSQSIGEQNLDFEYDGMTELWFDAVEVLNEARTSPEWVRSMADSGNFINAETAACFVVEEREISVPDPTYGGIAEQGVTC